jgi:hypothetical protein
MWFFLKFASIVELNPSIAVKLILAYQELDSTDLSPYVYFFQN